MRSLTQGVLILTCLIILFLTSCIKDDLEKLKGDNWNPEFAIPLIDSRFDVYRVFKKSNDSGFVLTGTDHVISLVYSRELFRVSGGELFSLPDVPFDLTIAQGELPFTGTGILLKHLDFDQGMLQVHIVHSVTEDVFIKLNMPRTTKNGIPFQKTFTIRYKGSSVTAFDTIFDLSQYKSDLSGSSGQESNKLNIHYVSSRLASGTPAPLNAFIVDFKDLSFNYLGGYFGKINIGKFSDSLGFTAFENFTTGGLKFEDPKIIITTDNGFGIPAFMFFNKFSGNRSGVSSELTGNIIDNGMIIKAAIDSAISVVSIEEVNDGNSNLGDFLSTPPHALNFDIDLEANPNNDTTVYNFVSSKSELVGNIAVDLPLKGRLNSVVFENIYDFQSNGLDNVDKAIVKIWTKNFFPLGVNMQLYFIDSTEMIFDSLILDGSKIFKEAILDDQGFSRIPSIEESYVDIGAGKFNDINRDAKKMKLRAELLINQSSTQSIKIADDNYFEIKLGVIARIKQRL